MSKKYSVFFILFIISAVFFSCQKSIPDPPVAKVDNVIDTHWGVKVDDPYRYMENMDDPYVQDWFKQQSDYANTVLAGIPGKDKLLKRIKELDKNKTFRIFSVRRFADGSLFYKRRNAGESISKLYFRDAQGNEKLLVDPESMKTENDQHFSIGAYKPSHDGKYVVYGLAQGGSEQTIYHIKEVATGKALEATIDHVETAYNTPNWCQESQGFYYSRRQQLPDDAPATEIYKKTKVYFHKVGTSQAEDMLISEMGKSSRVKMGEVDFPSIYDPVKSPYTILKIKHGDSNPLTLYAAPKKSIKKKDIPWVKICDVEDEVTEYAVFGNDIYLMTSHNAPRFKVVKTSLERPDFKKAKTVIPEGDYVVEYVSTTKDGLYAGIIDGGFNKIIRCAYKDPTPFVLELPGNAAGYVSSVSHELDGIYVYTSSWTQGSKVYEYRPADNSYTDTQLLPEGKFDNVPGFTSKEVSVKSHDGAMVPLSIVYPENIKMDGSNPALVMGYGSYGISQGVYFSAVNIAWLEQGGVLAYAHIRGGGEKGKDWHLQGQKINKVNTWMDFIACTEYLISEGYTSKDKVAGQGGSAGGITIGRAITTRPDLYRAAIINVGSLDAIRAETTTNGVPNIIEFGTVKDETEFKGLLAMSSYHHVKDGTNYPAVLLTHGINDPRVEPWMSAKMTARLQAATTGEKPIIFRVNYSAGHGIGSTRDQYLEEQADEWAFLLWQFGHPSFN